MPPPIYVGCFAAVALLVLWAIVKRWERNAPRRGPLELRIRFDAEVDQQAAERSPDKALAAAEDPLGAASSENRFQRQAAAGP